MENGKSSNTIKKQIGILILIICLGFVIKIIFFPPNFYYAGTLEATKIDISSRLVSVISKNNYQEGSTITKGDTLMSLACEDHHLAQKIAAQNFIRAARLYKQGSQSEESYDQIKNRKEEADLRLSWCTIVSPISGTILNKYHEEGEMVNVGTKLFTLANLKADLYATIYIPQELIFQIKIGQKLSGYLPEMNMRKFDGIVAKVAEEAEFTPKNVQTREERTRLVFAVDISFQNPEEILKPGMTIEVKI